MGVESSFLDCRAYDFLRGTEHIARIALADSGFCTVYGVVEGHEPTPLVKDVSLRAARLFVEQVFF